MMHPSRKDEPGGFMATLFTRIINREIPASVLYEDQLCIVILDIAPVNKGHALVISKEAYETVNDCPSEKLTHLMDVTKQTVRKMEEVLGIDGYNILVNNRPASGQEVPHLHIHVIPRYAQDRKTPVFSKEQYLDGEIDQYAEKLKF